MADFETRALIQVVVGYQTCLYATLVNSGGYNNQPLFIISFLLFTASLIIVTMQKFEILKDNVILLVCAIVMLFISGLKPRVSHLYHCKTFYSYRMSFDARTSGCMALYWHERSRGRWSSLFHTK